MNTYLKILIPESNSRSKSGYARSLEAYLNKNNHPFNIKDESYIIDVLDKNEAMRIAMDLRRYKKFEYFDGIEISPLIIDLCYISKNTGRSYAIVGEKSDKLITRKKFVEYSNDRIRSKCLNKADIIKRGLLTKLELKKAITDGKLTIIKFKSKCFIDREELAEYIKSTFN